nr:MAG TPA: hypothetical protein [Caudoviricetes sp.]
MTRFFCTFLVTLYKIKFNHFITTFVLRYFISVT